MRIIGSKTAKLEKLTGILRREIPDFEMMLHVGFYDVMCGIGTVSTEMTKFGRVVASDMLESFSLITYREMFSALPESTGFFQLNRLIELLNWRVNKRFDKGELDSFTQDFQIAYSDRYPYYSADNAKRLGLYRDEIKKLHLEGLADEVEQKYLLGELLVNALEHARIMLAFDVPCKRIRKNLDNPVYFKAAEPKPVRAKRSEVHCADFKTILPQIHGGILYLDPPAYRKQYHYYYHVLETLFRGKLNLVGITGSSGRDITQEGELSDWSKHNQVWKTLNYALQNNHADYVVMTYSKNGLLPEEHIKEAFLRNGDKHFYRKFDLDSENLYLIRSLARS